MRDCLLVCIVEVCADEDDHDVLGRVLVGLAEPGVEAEEGVLAAWGRGYLVMS